MKTDLLIIGGGLAGLTAAYEVLKAEPGRRITILRPGAGSSPYVHGFNMPLNPQDSTELFIQDTEASGRGQGNAALVEELCRGSLELLPFFDELGLDFNREADGSYQQLRPLGASCPRVISIGNDAGGAILRKLLTVMEQHENVSVCTTLHALRLITEDGRVCGAHCFDTQSKRWMQIKAKAVILAAGGFCRIFPFSTNSADLGGDAMAMALDAGAELTDMEFVQFEPSAAVWPLGIAGKSVITTLFYEGAVLRNGKGERFMFRYSDKGECADKDVLSFAIASEIAAGRGTEHGGVAFDASGVGRERLEEAYSAYVKRYRAVGMDIAEQAMEIAPAAHTSLGGVYARPDCSTSVEGLFVCGETLGGLHGANRIGGNAGLETMVFGRRAGCSAAAYMDTFSGEPADCTDEISDAAATVNIDALRAELTKIVGGALGVIREAGKLEQAKTELERMLEQIPESGCYAQERLRNDTLTAYAVTLAALERKTSTGCHVRTDSVGEPEKYRVNIRCENGRAVPRRAEI